MHLFRSLSPSNLGVQTTSTNSRKGEESFSASSPTTAANLKPILVNNKSNSERNFHGEDTSSILLTKPAEKTKDKKTVKFSTITTRTYPMTLGCNPAVSCGVPVEIEWKHTTQTTKSVHSMNPTIRIHRSSENLKLSRLERSRICKDAGYTKMEIGERIYEVNQIKKLREQSIEEYIITENETSKSLLLMLTSPLQRVWKNGFSGLVMMKTTAATATTTTSNKDDNMFAAHKESISNLLNKSSPISFHPSRFHRQKTESMMQSSSSSSTTTTTSTCAAATATTTFKKSDQVMPVH
jgi:hypothetical protein